MAATKSCRTTGTSSSKMVVTFGFFLLLAGLPFREILAEHAAESKNPSAKECRAHVEKALDQYFDSKGSTGPESQTTIKATAYNPQQTDQDDNDDDDDEDLPLKDKHSNESDDEADQDDDEDDEDDEVNKINENTECNDDEDEEDNNSKANDDDDNDDDKNVKIDNEEDEDTDADDEDDNEDDETHNYEAKASSKNDDDDDEDDEENDQEEDDDDDENEVEENVTKDNIKVEDEDDDTDEDDEADENNEADDEEDDDDEDESTEAITQSEEVSKESDDEDIDEEDDENSNESDEDEETETDQTDHNDEVSEDNEEDEEKKADDKIDATPASTIKPDDEVHQVPRTLADNEKVTGATDSAASRVAPELPGTTTAPELSQAQENEEEEAQEALSSSAGGDLTKQSMAHTDGRVEDDYDHDEDDDIENIYEDDDNDEPVGLKFRSRDHIDAILNLDDIGTEYDHQEDKLAQSIFRDIKRIHAMSIKPMEMLYKFTESTSRLLGDAEIFCKPMILFLGPWSTGKTTILNYLLGIERTPTALKTGTGMTDVDFSVITYGDQRQTISGTELAVDWRYASLQKFGQGFLDHFKSITMPHTLLKKVTLVDTPGILESLKNTERGYSLSDAFQWFIDRADAIYVVLDPSKVDIGAELGRVLDQLKGREVRFILSKADTIRRSDLMKVVGQLFWNLSPLMSGTEAPVIYATSLSTKPFNPTAPAKFLFDQESNFLYDLKDTMSKRVENRILYARRHAVRVRNHAKMIDCYLSTYYKHKSIFSSKRNVAKLITENPTDYNIYEGLSSMTNVSRYDLPNPTVYKNFFKQYALYDFKPLASTCSYFRGCPMEKLDNAIANELPELFAKYKKAKNDSPQLTAKQEGR